MDEPSEYNFRLKAEIKRSGRVQLWIARQAGISQYELSRIVNGHSEPTKESRRAIAKALKVKQAKIF